MTVKLENVGLNRADRIIKIANLKPVFSLENESIFHTVDKILTTGHRRLPILNKKREVVGIFTYMDILDAFLRGEGLKESISAIMIRDLISCDYRDSLGFVLQKLKLSKRGGLPIINNKKLAGMISERDFIKNFSSNLFNIKVKETMTNKPFFIPSSMSILDCLKSCVNTHYRRLPIVEEGKLIAIVTASDLLRFIRDHKYKFDDLDEPIDRIMIENVSTISEDMDLSDAVKYIKEKDVGGLIVVDEKNRLNGIITERDILEEIE